MSRFPFFGHHVPQLLRFAVTGGAGTVIDLGSLRLLVEVFSVHQYVASALSSLLGMTFVFFVNKQFTFRNRERRYAAQALKFYSVYGISYVLNVLLSWLLMWFGIHYQIAKFIAIGVLALLNYVASHTFIFRKRDPQVVVG